MSHRKSPDDANRLKLEDRWLLNFSLANLIKNNVQKNMEYISKELKKNKILMDETVERVDIDLLQRQDIIAMTTTGAASHKKILSQINSKIMVVEEAAEILESHIFTALNPNIEQLVLIGDQQQLRPKVNVHDLTKKYNFDISLFERLINNNFDFVKLQSQRRMRPEISQIIRLIYPDLQDNQDVFGRPSVKGMGDRNYFFFNHQFPEQELQNLQTKINTKEAEMVVGLCQYLLQQNYESQQITILTLYAGQLLTIRNIVKQQYRDQPINRVRVCNVDDYQGEENEIILLSLVRSNQNDQIGFLKNPNRICVALSRARLGLYIFGNALCLRNAALKHSQEKNGGQDHLWLKIIQVLAEKNQIDDKIVLKCLNHNKETIIKDAADFKNCPEGGCKEMCQARMECGHSCESCCHNYDNTIQDDPTGHNQIKCLKSCQKVKQCGHKCKWQCYQCKNGMVNGHYKLCQEIVSKILRCNHENNYRCYQLYEQQEIECQKYCVNILKCGHQCQKKCSIDCNQIYPKDLKHGYTSACKQKVYKDFPCGHKNEIDCGLPIGNIKCESKCNKILECGHPCPKRCYECKDQIFHGDCDKKCGKINPCNHDCIDKTCSKPCPPCIKKCTISCLHSKCTKNCGDPCVECKEKCKYRCEHSECTKLCFEICDRQPCNEPCKKSLKCGHLCIGFCGENCPQICKVQVCKLYDKSTFEIFFGNEEDEDAKFVLLEDCGHAIEYNGLQCWLQSQNESNMIKYPECPRCKQQIKNCQRIQETLKKITKKVNNVKNKICLDQKQIQDQEITKEKIEKFEQKIKDYEKNLKNTFSVFQIEKVFKDVFQNSCDLRQKKYGHSVQQIITVANTMNFCEMLMSTLKFWNEVQFNQLTFVTEQIKNLGPVLNEIVKKNLHSNRIEKIHRMIETFDIILRLYNSYSNAFQGDQELKKILAYLIGKKLVLTYEELEVIKKKKQKFDDKAFKQMIIKAVGLDSGHWFECPNGHPYVITECGGAMQMSRCPACNAVIGGANHDLINSNRLARFAGGTRPAWDPDNFANNLRAAQELNRQLNGNI